MDEFNAKLAKEINIPSLDWANYYMEAVEPIEQMKELLEWIAKNYHTGLLTNIMPGFVNEMLERNLIPDVQYDVIVDSSVVGAIKPEPAIYEEAEARSNCLPSEILLIDDSRTNLMVAGKRGWKVLWFDDFRPEESIINIKKALEFED